MSSIHEKNPDVCAKVFRSWKFARDALSHSIQTYLDACDALSSVSIEQIVHSNSIWGKSLPDALSVIDNELSGLADEEERLRNARLAILVSRNNSKSFSKVNSLPPEILSSIFLAANPYLEGIVLMPCTRYPAVISSVCQLWRQIALHLPSMWSHLSIFVDGPNQVYSQNCAELWGQRSKNSPLHLELFQLEYQVDPFQPFEDLSEVLFPLIPHIQNFSIRCSHYFMQLVLCSMIEKGASRSTKTLQLRSRDTAIPSTDLLSWHEDIDNPPHPSRVTKFLASIQYLELANVFFPWHSAAYHGLIELSLDLSQGGVNDADRFPTQHKMAQILSSSPMLRAISLTVKSSCQRQRSSIQPIPLNNLQSFALKSRSPTSCLGFLPLVAPGPSPLSVDITVYSDTRFTEELNSFFQRSNIAKLRISLNDPQLRLMPISRNLSKLESLTLANCDLEDETLQNYLLTPSTSNLQAPPWPQLHTLVLEQCQICDDIVVNLISLHPIRTIRLQGGSNIKSRKRFDLIDTSMRELERKLSVIVPDTKYCVYYPLIIRD